MPDDITKPQRWTGSIQAHANGGLVSYSDYMTVAGEVARLTAECLRLRSCLATANSQAEQFERDWYLRGDALEVLRSEFVNQLAAAEMARGALVLCQTERGRLAAEVQALSRTVAAMRAFMSGVHPDLPSKFDAAAIEWAARTAKEW